MFLYDILLGGVLGIIISSTDFHNCPDIPILDLGCEVKPFTSPQNP